MSDKICTIWSFETATLRVEVNALVENDIVDLSWDETGIVTEQIKSGELEVFMVQARIVHKATDVELAVDYLGQCIHPSFEDFRDHVGLARKSREDGRNYGSYFSQMVRENCRAAREDMGWIKKALNDTVMKEIA